MAAGVYYLQKEDLDVLREWLIQNKESVPGHISAIIENFTKIYQHLVEIKGSSARTLQRLREAMGIAPKSERGKQLIKKAAESDDEKIEIAKKQIKTLKKRKSKIQLEINTYSKLLKSKSKKVTSTPVEPKLEIPEEKVFHGTPNNVDERKKRVPVDKNKNFDNSRGLHTVAGKRTRYETEVKITKMTYEVETVTDLRTGESVTASMDDIGPRKYQVTWVTVVTIINCVIGYAMPINRLAKLLGESCKYFTSGRITGILLMAAKLLEPIYCQLGEELADSDILAGDDTPTRILELERYIENGELDKVKEPKSSLVAKLADMFGRISYTKDNSRPQKRINVSLVTGKTEPSDKRSYIFFFHAHLGHLGNLLTKLLEMRKPSLNRLVFQGDLLSANMPSKTIKEKFEIVWAGCLAHARRPFARYLDDDELLCYSMLRRFAMLSVIEDKIDEKGRTQKNVLYFRQKFSFKVWKSILEICKQVVNNTWDIYWPKGSALYKACQYIVRNFSELTCYLNDPRLEPTNNMRERLLRWDKIMLDSSKFRKTEQGRSSIDILRTIVHTASAAEINLVEYLKFVFKNHKDIKEQPERYTPFAYALMLESNNSSTTQ